MTNVNNPKLVARYVAPSTPHWLVSCVCLTAVGGSGGDILTDRDVQVVVVVMIKMTLSDDVHGCDALVLVVPWSAAVGMWLLLLGHCIHSCNVRPSHTFSHHSMPYHITHFSQPPPSSMQPISSGSAGAALVAGSAWCALQIASSVAGRALRSPPSSSRYRKRPGTRCGHNRARDPGEAD